MERDKVFQGIREITVNNSLSQVQVDSINAILDACEHKKVSGNSLAYVLATAYHESRFKPVEEIGKGKGRPYGKPDAKTGKIYYGRGFCQLTWIDNYRTFGKIIGIDLVNRPELALQVDYAADILIIGMANGLFTGKKLADYFTGKTNDPINARKIVNGSDKASLIAGYYNHILEFLQ